jgi:hypothetical protein
MTTSAPERNRSTIGTRRAGYLVGAAVNGMLLLAVNLWPGWQVVPFLTEDIERVLLVINLSMAAGLFVNLVYALHDATRVKALGSLVTLGFGGAALIGLLRVFPFDFGDTSFDWALVVRIVLTVGLVGTAIGMVVQLVAVLRRPGQGPATR